ncbi:REC8 meiotic recombination protein b [Nematolebias whitei]|uniref:REC8 meiotic recombination protein b n=1 Tax=Nematolebias whitei TaxID=451745 RepID=UPI00189BEB68|nr:REC8 meiotic recombination protein b [Nematolebias whitei]
MFYYPNVLQRHSGCFSTIWLAATRGIRVTRREFLKVNVNQTCREILDYVTAQVLAPQPDQPRPRFSLYLSSQLQYGVVVVYHRQCGFLLEEIQQTIDRLLRSKTYMQISVADTDRMILDLPDGLCTMEETEGALDPFFGLMESQQLPSPYKIHQVEFEVSVQPSPDKENFSSPSAAITLTEKEPVVINAAECFEGDDLPEATIKDIDLLMDQPDQFRQEVVEEQTEDRTRDQGVVSPTGPLKDTLGTERDSEWLLDEKTGQAALTGVAVEMTPPNVAMPSEDVEGHSAASPCEEVAPPRRRHRGGRRRQLVFVDPQVQISEGAMKEQIGNQWTETQNLNKVLLDLQASTRRVAPAQLFSAPCCPSLIHPDLLLLWKQRASLAVLPSGEERRGAEGESEQDMEVVRAERRRRSRMKEPLGDSGLQTSEGPSVVDVMLDLSKEDKSGSDVMTPVSRWSPQEDAQPPMEVILEEAIELPEAQFDPESRNSASWISSALQHLEEVTFDSILPPEADRFTAAQTLYRLLELLSDKKLTAHQTEPYGDIIIKSGGGLKMAA